MDFLRSKGCLFSSIYVNFPSAIRYQVDISFFRGGDRSRVVWIDDEKKYEFRACGSPYDSLFGPTRIIGKFASPEECEAVFKKVEDWWDHIN